jgi:hypothetical protein
MMDEILIAAVLVMLAASTYGATVLQRALFHQRKAFEALVKQLDQIEERLAELEQR